MAFFLGQSPSASVAPSATSASVTVAAPALGQLLSGACGLYATGTPVISIADNGSGGWTLIKSSIDLSGAQQYIYWWYKEATSTDVASMTHVAYSWTNGSTVLHGSAAMDEYDGFVGTPTLDLNPTAVEGSSNTITLTGGVAAQTNELALSLVGYEGGAITSPGGTYSPNNGTTTYNWATTLSAFAGGVDPYGTFRCWASPAATPATASKFIMNWTTSRFSVAMGATFYDNGPILQNHWPHQAVQRASFR